MESPMPPESNEHSAADTPPPSQIPASTPGSPPGAPSGASDPWPRQDAPPPRWSEPPASRPAEPPPVGVFTGLGIVAATFFVTLVAMWFAAGAPLLVLSLMVKAGIIEALSSGATNVTMALSALLAVAAAIVIARWCNQPSRRHIRTPLNIGFGCALAPLALIAVFLGLCIASTNSMY